MKLDQLTRSVLSSKHLRQEILIAACLVFVALLVFFGYLFPGATASSWFANRSSLPVVIGILALLVIFGFVIIWQIIEPVLRISKDAKIIASGDLSREIRLAREDELGELGASVNALTRRIRENVEELNSLNQKTKHLNDEINHRIAMLSNLLEISNHVAQKTVLKDILHVIVTRCFPDQGYPFGCVILKDHISNEYKIQYLHSPKAEQLDRHVVVQMHIPLGVGVLGKAILRQELFVIDQETTNTEDIENFCGIFKLRNAIIAPISSTGHAYGLIICGNDKDNFICGDAQKDFMRLVSKHIAIAILNDLLTQEIEKFEVTDALTGLYNNAYVRSRLGFEVKQAVNTQKTCSFILIKIDRFRPYLEQYGHIGAEDVLLKTASAIKSSLPSHAKAARFSEHEFALILPMVSKKDAIHLADELKLKIVSLFSGDEQVMRRLTASLAVVENPLDGRTADELILKGGILMADAIEQGGNRVSFQK